MSGGGVEGGIERISSGLHTERGSPMGLDLIT